MLAVGHQGLTPASRIKVYYLTDAPERQTMLELEDLKTKTAQAFATDPFAVPEPGLAWQRRLEALEAAGLHRQRAAAIFDMRCEQADKMGMVRVSFADCAAMLMGEEPTDRGENATEARQTLEWLFNHHTGETLAGWGSRPQDFWRVERRGPWHLPPFARTETWRCRRGKLDYLKRDIPYGVVLRVNEIKALKLFNHFEVVAPVEAWVSATDIDPVAVACIDEFPPDGDGKYVTTGRVQPYFVAQW